MKRGWFTIPGLQLGERDVKERVKPLATVLKHAKGASIADFGCAEGLIGKWLMDHGGAISLHGFDKHEPYLETAREIFADYDARFDVCDLDEFEQWREAHPPLPRFTIVLALNVLHKLARPADVLRSIASLCDDMLVLSLPHFVIRDSRSNNVPVDPAAILADEFRLIETHEGHTDPQKGRLGIRTIYRRTMRRRGVI